MTDSRKLSQKLLDKYHAGAFDLDAADILRRFEDAHQEEHASNTPDQEAPQATFENTPEILEVDELADILRVNSKTLYNAANAGEIPSKRVGKGIRFLKSAVRDWLSELEQE